MSSIPIPKDTLPSFDALCKGRLGELNDFEAVTFYADFTRMMNSCLLTPSIDLMCAEAALQTRLKFLKHQLITKPEQKKQS